MTQAVPIMLLALQPYLVRPTVDFDMIIDALKEQGTWVAVEEGKEQYYFNPNETMSAAVPPYRNGQWHYTDYGWTWKGEHPDSWALDHYGFWSQSLSGKKHWVWAPTIHWLPSTVEWLQSGEYYGWRACQLDRFSNPVEPESQRYRDPEEWNFVHRSKLSQPLTAADFATKEKTVALMEEALPVDHIYKAYREIGRPGPDPSILMDDPENPEALPVIPVTLSLPDLRHQPKEVLPDQYYVYRPDFYQDADGIMRRIHLFLYPREVPDEQKLKEMFSASEEDKKKKQEMIEKMEKGLERQRKHMESLYD
jgi:hypothetical protein